MKRNTTEHTKRRENGAPNEKKEHRMAQIHKDGEGHPKKCSYILYIISSWYIEFAHVKQPTSTPNDIHTTTIL